VNSKQESVKIENRQRDEQLGKEQASSKAPRISSETRLLLEIAICTVLFSVRKIQEWKFHAEWVYYFLAIRRRVKLEAWLLPKRLVIFVDVEENQKHKLFWQPFPLQALLAYISWLSGCEH
jgi:hypothetical protein